MQPKELSKRDTMLLHIIPTLLVFVSFLGVTAWSTYSAYQDLGKEQDRLINQTVSSTEKAMQDRLTVYEEVLKAGEAIFNASTEVTRNDWQNYTNTFDIGHQYPGLQGIGYNPVVTKDNLETYTQSIREQGFPDYHVFPEGERPIYTPIKYIEPFSGRNLQAFGYDTYSSPTRKAAFDRARDSHSPAISGKITLVQDAQEPEEPGFLMVLPVYDTNKPTATVEQRRDAISGFISAPFRTRELFGNIFSSVHSNNPNIGFRIYGGSIDTKNLLYESPTFASIKKSVRGNPVSHISIDGQDFVVQYHISPDNIPRSVGYRPLNTLFGGFLFSAILAGLVLVLLRSRTRALAYAEAREVQQAKDDLLSLASHQLRTPATGVKQYIGMLRQGYAGRITKQQRELLDKAFQSNERQLGIIDEILHVARLDAGQIRLSISQVNVSKLLRDIVNEHREVINKRQQKIRLHLPKKPIIIESDPQYLRMVIENLLSNASKYTFKKGRIDVSLSLKDGLLTLTLKDTGVGISKQQEPLLFKKFSRIYNDLTRQTEGSGIGLYITQKIITLHGGLITVESEPNVGSIFTVVLPEKFNGRQLYNKEEA